jgi:hypothetical protein
MGTNTVIKISLVPDIRRATAANVGNFISWQRIIECLERAGEFHQAVRLEVDERGVTYFVERQPTNPVLPPIPAAPSQFVQQTWWEPKLKTALIAAVTAIALAIATASPALAGDGWNNMPGPAPIDEDVVNAYRLCEANYRTVESYAVATSFANNPRYRLESCNRVLEVYKHETEVHDQQFLDFVTRTYTGDPVPAAAPIMVPKVPN